jgi:hypothetical protein
MKPQCAPKRSRWTAVRRHSRYTWKRGIPKVCAFLATVVFVLLEGGLPQEATASWPCHCRQNPTSSAWDACIRACYAANGCRGDPFNGWAYAADGRRVTNGKECLTRRGAGAPATARASKSSGAHRTETVTRSEPPPKSTEKRAPSTEVSEREPTRRSTRGHGSMQPADLGDAVLEEWPAPSTGNSNPQNPCLNGPTSPGCVLGATPPPPQVVLTIRPPPPPPARPPVPPWWIDTLGNRLVGEQAGAQSLNDVIQQRIEQRDAEARQANDQGTTSLDDIVNKTKNCAPEEGPDGVVHRKWCPCPWFTDEEGNDVSHREARDFCGGPNSVCGIQPMYQNPNGYDMKDQARFGDCYDGCVKKINDYNALYDKECPKGGGRK